MCCSFSLVLTKPERQDVGIKVFHLATMLRPVGDASINSGDFDMRNVEIAPLIVVAFRVDENLVLDLKTDFLDVFSAFRRPSVEIFEVLVVRLPPASRSANDDEAAFVPLAAENDICARKVSEMFCHGR